MSSLDEGFRLSHRATHPVGVVVYRSCGQQGSAKVVVPTLGGWCVLVGASWVLETGSVTVAGVRCERSGASVWGADILLETRLSAAKSG